MWRKVLAGAAAGLAASWMMNQFQGAWSRVAREIAKDGERQGKPQERDEDESATVKAAERIASCAGHSELTQGEKKIAGPMVHYGFGAAMGALYGGLGEKASILRIGAGTLFGSGLWFGADEVMVPALGLSKPPICSPLSVHLQALAAHLVYGITTEAVRRGLRATILKA